MTIEKMESMASANLPAVPPPVIVGRLREHFRRTYLLNENQVETMVASSSKSLGQAISNARKSLGGKEQKASFTLTFHSLKGLLLNMGESEWADFARECEKRLTGGEPIDCAAAIGIIEKGMAEVLSYGEGMAPAAIYSTNGS